MNMRFVLVPEDSEAFCEMGTFVGFRTCSFPQYFAIIDTDDKSDPSYPEGFHLAHGCYDHALTMLELTVERNKT